MYEPKRLHPIAAVLNALKQLKELALPFLAVVVFGSQGSGFDMVSWIGSAVFILFIIVSGVLSWARFTYRLEEGELRIEHGLIVRKKRYIPLERIQSLDLSEGIFHRPFGLVKVSVETAGSSGLQAEAVLTAITKKEAQAIQEVLHRAKHEGRDEEEIQEFIPEETVLYKISPTELFLLASTSGGVGVVISAVFAFLTQFDEIIPYDRVFKGFQDFVSSGILFISILVFIGFLIAWIFAIIMVMFKYAGFTLKRVENDFIITRGLLEKRQLTIPLKRIQGIRISENLVRQPLKLATVTLESAGGSMENESSSVMILPLIKKERIRGILEPHLESYALLDDFTPAPKRALSRYVLRGMFLVIPFNVVFILIFKLWGLLSLLLVPVSLLWSYFKFKDAGWKIDNNQLNLRFRTLVKHSVFMRKNNIQSLGSKESFFQRRKDLSSIDATVKSGSGAKGGTVVDLDKEDVLSIYDWYSRTS